MENVVDNRADISFAYLNHHYQRNKSKIVEGVIEDEYPMIAVNLKSNMECAHPFDKILCKVLIKNFGKDNYTNLSLFVAATEGMRLIPGTIYVNGMFINATLDYIPIPDLSEFCNEIKVTFSLYVEEKLHGTDLRVEQEAFLYYKENSHDRVIKSNAIEFRLTTDYVNICRKQYLVLPNIMPKICKVQSINSYPIRVFNIIQTKKKQILKVVFAIEMIYLSKDGQTHYYYQTYESYTCICRFLNPVSVNISEVKKIKVCNGHSVNTLIELSFYDRLYKESC